MAKLSIKQTSVQRKESIKDATIRVISTQGISSATVAAIAFKADVSVGYLYRHYKGKDELLMSLVEEIVDEIAQQLEQIFTTNCCFNEAVAKFVKYITENRDIKRDTIRFLILMQNDFSVPLNSSISTRIKQMCHHIEKKANDSGFRDDLTIGEIYLALFVLPLQYIAAQDKGVINNEDISENLLLNMIISSLKKA